MSTNESGGMNQLKVGKGKAIWGAVVTFLIAIIGGIQIASAAGADFSNWVTWVNIVGFALGGGAATGSTVYGVTNKVLTK